MRDVVRCLQGAGLKLGTRSIYNYLALASRKHKEEKDPEAAQLKQALILVRQESAPAGMEAAAKADELSSALCGEALAADDPAQAPEDAAPAAETLPAEAIPAVEELMPCPGVPSGTDDQPADESLSEEQLADALEQPSAMDAQESILQPDPMTAWMSRHNLPQARSLAPGRKPPPPAEEGFEEHSAGNVQAKAAAPARDQKRASKRKHGHPQRRLNKR